MPERGGTKLERVLKPAGRRFYAVGADALAERLIGCYLVRTLESGERLVGRIVETEAYMGAEDAASHAFGNRRTARTEAMFGKPGTSYVYFTYGMHYCMNVVCGREHVPLAVLLRALEPIEGLETMRVHRTGRPKARREIPDADLCRGPARLCSALAIGPEFNNTDMVTSDRLFVSPARRPKDWRVVTAPRVGIQRRPEPWLSRPLRWLVDGHPCVSVGVPRLRSA